jgi:hypothetical protein
MKAKIERAEEHVNNLKREIDAFLKCEPYTAIAENEEKTGDRVFRVHVNNQMPIRFGLIAGDSIHNLRAALDYLMWQLVEANGQTPNTSTEFLIGSDANDFTTRCKGKIAKMGISTDAMTLIEALKPYFGGNDGLYALHRLDIRDKHRLLVAVGGLRERIIYNYNPELIRIVDFRLGGPEGPQVPFKPEWIALHYAPAYSCFPLEEGTEIHRLTAAQIQRGKVEMNPKFGFQIAFGEKGIFEGEPLIESLRKLTNLLDGILNVFGTLPELK